MGFHALSAEINSLCQELISTLCEGHVNPRTCMILISLQCAGLY